MRTRKKLLITGTVQGIGFRPFVYKTAVRSGVSGFVKNTSRGVVVECEGKKNDVGAFIRDIGRLKPAGALIDSLKISDLSPKKGVKFFILKSGREKGVSANIPPDLAVCPDCRKEMFAPENRRYLYPFINCTNCGPRFTIVERVPYDRPYTTMKKFKMCAACRAEYENPLDRRFHAQPNACPGCGPQVFALEAGGGRIRGPEAVRAAAGIIAGGGICAIKSLGGFQLACDALNEKAVSRLRRAKQRPFKPFAVMVADIKAAEKICFIGKKEREELLSPAAPIVALRKKNRDLENVSPDLSTAGVMISYTPLHDVLFRALSEREFKNPLVMTSGNRRDEPIAKNLRQAREKLLPFSDLILCHDRDIHNRADDSVIFVLKNRSYFMRRARGCVPSPVSLNLETSENVLAMGADLKNTFCLARRGEAFVSQHIGDLAEVENQKFQVETVKKFKDLLGVKRHKVVCDPHPDYFSSAMALKFSKKPLRVQHHLAHAASVMAERGLQCPVLGVVFDGTGYGVDGNIWGGEFILIEGKKARRTAHLKYFPLPGGDAAAGEIWRSAFSLLKAAGAPPRFYRDFFKTAGERNLAVAERMIKTGVNSPLTSSAGRLFDAAAFLAGVRKYADYEAQAPMEFESFFRRRSGRPYRMNVERRPGGVVVDAAPALVLMARDRERGAGIRLMSEKFHTGVFEMIKEVCRILKEETGVRALVFSGGVFQNRALVEMCLELEEPGCEVYFNGRVPSNDAGVSLGQAYCALKGINLVYEPTSKVGSVVY